MVAAATQRAEAPGQKVDWAKAARRWKLEPVKS
mgnify:CR=1 FL=1